MVIWYREHHVELTESEKCTAETAAVSRSVVAAIMNIPKYVICYFSRLNVDAQDSKAKGRGPETQGNITGFYEKDQNVLH